MTPEKVEKMQSQGEAVVFLVYKDGDVYLMERLKEGSGYFGYTIIPGGKIESFDLNPESAVVREVAEEMGIKLIHMVHLDSYLDMSLSGNFRKNHAFLVDEFEGEVTSIEPEKERLVCVPITCAKDKMELAAGRYLIELARKYLGI